MHSENKLKTLIKWQAVKQKESHESSDL